MEVLVGLVVSDGATGLCAVARPTVEMAVAVICCFDGLREKGERGREAKEPDRLGFEGGEAMSEYGGPAKAAHQDNQAHTAEVRDARRSCLFP